MDCPGTGDDHCCWVDGAPCRFLEEWTVDGRRWACGLRRELGSWDAVHRSTRYRRHVRPTLKPLGVECGDWPPPGGCATCGMGG